MIKLLPIAQRELRLASRRPGTYWLRCCSAGLIGGVLFAMATTTNEPPSRVSGIIFWTLKAMAFTYCLLAGVGCTADALSKERREGTLGLLFLTDLRGYDVVIGKLAMTSMTMFFGLLAAIPLLAVPVMMGGVSAAEFWRTTLVLLNTLAVSLSAGMAVSAFGVHERSVMLRTLLLIVFVTFGLPGGWYALGKPTGTGWLEIILLFPSPWYALKISSSGLVAPVPSDFWPCMAAVAGMSLGFVAIASLHLPRTVQETAGLLATEGPGSRAYQLRFGTRRVRAHLRKHLVHGRPYLWRVSRDRTMVQWSLLLAVLAMVFGVWTTATLPPTGMGSPSAPVVFAWLGGHWLLKLLVVVEACRPFSEDKHAGTLELILCTPLPPGEMVAAQRRRLRNLFSLPVGVVCLANYLIASEINERVLVTAFTMGIFTLAADCWALRWVGMRFSLSCNSYTRAVFSTLWRVMVPGWIAFFAMVLYMISSSGSEAAACGGLVLWSGGAVLFDIWLVARARLRLESGFRQLAAT